MDQAVNLVSGIEQEFRQIGAVLARDASDECAFHCLSMEEVAKLEGSKSRSYGACRRYWRNPPFVRSQYCTDIGSPSAYGFMERAFITGVAGFIGSNLADRLLLEGIAVVGWDNFSTGQLAFLENAQTYSTFRMWHGDNLDLRALTEAMCGCDFVFHLAANADVRFGTQHPRKDLEQNTIATFNVLEAMRSNGIRRIAFSSTGSAYGEALLFRRPKMAVPDPDFALRSLETCRRQPDSGGCRGIWFRGIYLQIRVDPGRAIHPRPRVRFLSATRRASRMAQGPRRWLSKEKLPLRARLHRRHAPCRRQFPIRRSLKNAPKSSISEPRTTCRSTRAFDSFVEPST